MNIHLGTACWCGKRSGERGGCILCRCLVEHIATDRPLGTHSLWHNAADDVPVIVVGGAAALCGDVLPGVFTVVRPQHADVANAVGAAIPQARP